MSMGTRTISKKNFQRTKKNSEQSFIRIKGRVRHQKILNILKIIRNDDFSGFFILFGPLLNSSFFKFSPSLECSYRRIFELWKDNIPKFQMGWLFLFESEKEFPEFHLRWWVKILWNFASSQRRQISVAGCIIYPAD